MIRTLFLILTSFFMTTTAFTAPSAKTADGLSFTVKDAALGGTDAVRYISVDLAIYNETDTQKIDFEEALNGALADEFNNHYRAVTKPSDYKGMEESKPPRFPSLYPGESYGKTLFFEAPVVKAKTLKLDVRSPVKGMPDPVKIEFTAPRNYPPVTSIIEIAEPEDGAVVMAGDVFRLSVETNADKVPQNILIVAFGKTLEDKAPSEKNDYDIVIPGETPVGESSISVIAHWTDPRSGHKEILSRNVIIYVNRLEQAASH